MSNVSEGLVVIDGSDEAAAENGEAVYDVAPKPYPESPSGGSFYTSFPAASPLPSATAKNADAAPDDRANAVVAPSPARGVNMSWHDIKLWVEARGQMWGPEWAAATDALLRRIRKGHRSYQNRR